MQILPLPVIYSTLISHILLCSPSAPLGIQRMWPLVKRNFEVCLTTGLTSCGYGGCSPVTFWRYLSIFVLEVELWCHRMRCGMQQESEAVFFLLCLLLIYCEYKR